MVLQKFKSGDSLSIRETVAAFCSYVLRAISVRQGRVFAVTFGISTRLFDGRWLCLRLEVVSV
jgi:hypothetical protein